MRVTRRLALLVPVVVSLAGGALWWRRTDRQQQLAMANRLAEPIPRPEGPMSVFHLGHSLVNRDMPAMLAQLAGAGHRYESQLGWGTTLKAHWGDEPINGFEAENAHPRFRDAHEAVESGDYDAIVLTEMVEIRDALRYFDSPDYFRRWAEKALGARADVRIYLYETWHRLDDAEGWLNRLDADLDRYWLDRIVKPTLAELPATALLRVIPAGQILAGFVRAVEGMGGVGNVRDRTDLFAKDTDGGLDQIHLNDLGNYLVALAHYAVLYQRSPVGLSANLRRADGSMADAPAPEAALLMQTTVVDVLSRLRVTGVSALSGDPFTL